MNKHILLIMDHQLNPGKYTKDQLRQNAFEAYVAADYIAANINDYFAAANANVNATAAATGRLIDRYFEKTKENKQDYIDEINTRGKNETDKY